MHINKIFGRHDGEDVIVVGSGSSLIGFDHSRLNPFVTIALNDAVKAPGFIPRYHIFSDGHLLDGNPKRNPSGGYKKLQYSPLTEILCPKQQRTEFVKVKGPEWKPIYQFDSSGSPNPVKPGDNGLFINRTVATGAIMMAWKLGARRIWLLGIDGYKWEVPKEGGGRKDIYYYDGTQKPKERRKIVSRHKHDGDRVMVIQDRHDFWKKQMAELRAYFKKQSNPYPGPFPGRGIYNLNPISQIEAWQRLGADLGLGYIEAFPGKRSS